MRRFLHKTFLDGDAKLFRRRNMDAYHVPAILNRLKEGICEAKVQEIMNRFFPQVMIDPRDGRLVEDLVQCPPEQNLTERTVHNRSSKRNTRGHLHRGSP